MRIFLPRGTKTLLIVIISLLLGYAIGVNKLAVQWKNFKPIASITSKSPPPGQNLDMNLFYEVLDRVNKDYYDKTKIDPKKLLYGAISGALGSLEDPYTSFLPPKENTSFKTQLSGQFEGIGAELGMSGDNRIMVVSPLDGSPAQRAGVKSGDKILAVDDKDTTGWTLPQAVERIRGPKGSTVVLTVLREKENDSREIKIVRDVITVKSVTSWVKTVECQGDSCREQADCATCANVAYVRIAQFGDKTNDEWTQAINSIYPRIRQEKNFKGIILDLRNNPGGYLQDAVFVASEFLKSGVVVVQEDNTGQQTKMNVSRRGILTDNPLIILVNKGSASASEIVAGALRDQRRAKIVGETTFGKGTIQQAVEVDAGASVHISIAKWLTPNGTWVDKKGLEPDIVVKYDESKSKGGGFDNQLQAAIAELLK